MKCSFAVVLFALAGVPLATAEARVDYSPVNRVVSLLRTLQAKVETEGKVEQRSYDKYACWTKDTLNRVAGEMEAQKKLIEDLEAKILELAADIASHTAEIKFLNKNIDENLAAQKDATDLRRKENGEFEEEKTESEQCIGALEAAIKVLTGAGTGGGFLQKIQEAQLLSVVGGVRDVLKKAPSGVPTSDLEMIKRFVENPQEFAHGQGMSAAQTGQNPFGDYAPQSTQIQGVLKGLYDAFTSDLEKDNAEESEKQKAYEQFMATKKQELETLRKTLAKQELDKGTKTAELADSKALKADTEEALAANEKLFQETKEAGRDMAIEWSRRVGLRTQELAGIGEAIKILSDPTSRGIFRNATTTFLQLKSISRHTQERSEDRSQAYRRLKALASRYMSMDMANIAAAVKSGGHFDKVIVMIDEMIALLRKEEQADIEHRDRCQNGEDRNKNEMEDLNHDINKAQSKLDRMDLEQQELESTISTLDGEINKTKADLAELLDMRNGDVRSFRDAMKDDTDAIKLIEDAIVALSRFYKDNKIPLALVRQGDSLVTAAPTSGETYSVDQNKAPEVVWGDEGANYGGARSESRGIIAILGMIKEDLEKEIMTGKSDDATAQSNYDKQRGALEEELDAKTDAKIKNEKTLAELQQEIVQTEDYKDGKHTDLGTEKDIETALYNDCSWVASHFESRRQKRKDEIQGLEEAKAFLAGVDAGDDDQLPP